jgi:hypothetical protein
VNPYGYVRNNPIGERDSTGMFLDGAAIKLAMRWGGAHPASGFSKGLWARIEEGETISARGAELGTAVIGDLNIKLTGHFATTAAPVIGAAADFGVPLGGVPAIYASSRVGPSQVGSAGGEPTFPPRPRSGTVGDLKIGYSAVAGHYYERGVAYVTDSHGEHWVFRVEAFGGASELAEAGMYIARQWTNASSGNDLGGSFTSDSVGISFGEGWMIGIEFNTGRGANGSWQGVTLQLGAQGGYLPVQLQGVTERWTPIAAGSR